MARTPPGVTVAAGVWVAVGTGVGVSVGAGDGLDGGLGSGWAVVPDGVAGASFSMSGGTCVAAAVAAGVSAGQPVLAGGPAPEWLGRPPNAAASTSTEAWSTATGPILASFRRFVAFMTASEFPA